jgi:hypothetical protein
VLAEAAPHDPSGSCQRVSELWTRVLTGEEPRAEEWAAAAAGARAARAAARAGARAAEAWAAEAASESAAEAASESAAEAASEAAPAAVAAAAAAWAAGFTWDRITTALLDGIELECGEHRREETQ